MDARLEELRIILNVGAPGDEPIAEELYKLAVDARLEVRQLRGELAGARYVLKAAKHSIEQHNGGKPCTCHLHDVLAAFEQTYGPLKFGG